MCIRDRDTAVRPLPCKSLLLTYDILLSLSIVCKFLLNSLRTLHSMIYTRYFAVVGVKLDSSMSARMLSTPLLLAASRSTTDVYKRQIHKCTQHSLLSYFLPEERHQYQNNERPGILYFHSGFFLHG